MTVFYSEDIYELLVFCWRNVNIFDPSVVAKKLRWLLQSEEIAGKIIAFDGKTMRGSKSGGSRGYHILSAFLTDDQIVLGEITCDKKATKSLQFLSF